MYGSLSIVPLSACRSLDCWGFPYLAGATRHFRRGCRAVGEFLLRPMGNCLSAVGRSLLQACHHCQQILARICGPASRMLTACGTLDVLSFFYSTLGEQHLPKVSIVGDSTWVYTIFSKVFGSYVVFGEAPLSKCLSVQGSLCRGASLMMESFQTCLRAMQSWTLRQYQQEWPRTRRVGQCLHLCSATIMNMNDT